MWKERERERERESKRLKIIRNNSGTTLANTWASQPLLERLSRGTSLAGRETDENNRRNGFEIQNLDTLNKLRASAFKRFRLKFSCRFGSAARTSNVGNSSGSSAVLEVTWKALESLRIKSLQSHLSLEQATESTTSIWGIFAGHPLGDSSRTRFWMKLITSSHHTELKSFTKRVPKIHKRQLVRQLFWTSGAHGSRCES